MSARSLLLTRPIVAPSSFSYCRSIGVYQDHSAGVNSVAFHPDGTCVAAGSADMTIKLWDLRSNTLLQHYPAHGDAVSGISFHER